MNRVRWLVSLVVFAVISGCSAGKDPVPNEAKQSLRLFDVMHAESDARAAALRGDVRLLAVNGYVVQVPGIDGDLGALRSKYGIRVLEGTSDASDNEDDARLQRSAREYSIKYNRTMISLDKR